MSFLGKKSPVWLRTWAARDLDFPSGQRSCLSVSEIAVEAESGRCREGARVGMLVC